MTTSARQTAGSEDPRRACEAYSAPFLTYFGHDGSGPGPVKEARLDGLSGSLVSSTLIFPLAIPRKDGCNLRPRRTDCRGAIPGNLAADYIVIVLFDK
jgi:hypothetical protein